MSCVVHHIQLVIDLKLYGCLLLLDQDVVIVQVQP